MIVKLRSGTEDVALDLRGLRVCPLAPNAPSGRDASALAATALDQPLTGPTLIDVAQGRRSATIVVPDATRKASLPEVLPVVVERLQRAGIGDSAITVLVANGTHPMAGPEAIRSLVGPLPEAIKVIEHDSRAPDLVEVGDLRSGLPLRLHPSAVECECLMTISTVRHHYFAGFGGGPKMVFPGVAGYREIQANHALVLDRSGDQAIRHPRCEPGVLNGNPVAEEISRAAGFRSPEITLAFVEGREGGIAWAGAGPWEAVFESAIERVRSWFEVPFRDQFDLMVADSGGSPTDTTLIQAHKGLDAACRFLKPGGELLWVASLDGGPGSEGMLPFIEDPRPESILDSLSKDWIQYGHTTLRIVEKTSRHRIRALSLFDPEILARMGFDPITDPESVVAGWRENHPGARVGVMATGAVFPRNP